MITTLIIFYSSIREIDFERMVKHLTRPSGLMMFEDLPKSTHSKMFRRACSRDSVTGLRRRGVDPYARCPDHNPLSVVTLSVVCSIYLVCLKGWFERVRGQSAGIINLRHTFLNSDAHFLIVVEIGGGSVAWAASTGNFLVQLLSGSESESSTFCQGWHPRLHRVRHALYKCTESQDYGM